MSDRPVDLEPAIPDLGLQGVLSAATVTRDMGLNGLWRVQGRVRGDHDRLGEAPGAFPPRGRPRGAQRAGSTDGCAILAPARGHLHSAMRAHAPGSCPGALDGEPAGSRGRALTLEAAAPARDSVVGQGSRLQVIIPALNEAATIQTVIAGIPRDLPGVTETCVLVIDDGSTDETAALARAAGAEVISHPRTLGVGVAIQRGLSEALQRSADMAVNIDGDGQFDPADIRLLLQPILEGRAQFVSASRFKDPALTPRMPLFKRWGNQWMSRLVSLITGQRFWDVSCGFRAYSSEALLRLALQGRFTYTQESFLVLSFKGVAILEIPVAVRGTREHGESRVASSLWLYGIRTARIIFSCFRDYNPSLVFNGISAAMLALAALFGTFFLGHRLLSGAFTPHIWSGFVAAGFFAIGFAVLLAGQIAAMINRVRFVQEEQLYLQRLSFRSRGDRDASAEKPPPADRR